MAHDRKLFCAVTGNVMPAKLTSIQAEDVAQYVIDQAAKDWASK
jgi:hypothetical protein